MTRDAVLSFSSQARAVREDIFGEPVTFGGVSATAICYPLNDMELSAGGFERAGQIRALIATNSAPNIHQVVTLRGQSWRVVQITSSNAFGETSQIWEPLP